MNIQQAVAQLEAGVRAYAARTPEGMPVVPAYAQRPIYLEGPPGVGKTAIVAQVACRMGIGLVSYTMTHHTRQSALGLPMIQKRSFGGREYSVTEYTMSEIIAEVYRQMEQTGCRAGILFLDEINCVSDTLLPAMLELLQHKRFGSHRLPEDWVIVCAGNPEKYNRNARSFDPVTLDRVRLMRIEPDAQAWLAYAAQTGVHAAIRAYLRMRPEDIYAEEGDNVVTPRSWCDLSDMLWALEAAGEAVDSLLFGQYIQCERISERFSLYYAMCAGVSRGFQLDQALFEGDSSSAAHFAAAAFDEALCCAELLAQRLHQLKQAAKQARSRATRLGYFIDAAQREAGDMQLYQTCLEQLERREQALQLRQEVGALPPEEEGQEKALHSLIRCAIAAMPGSEDPLAALRSHAEAAADTASKEEAIYHGAAQNARVFAELAFSGDSFQAKLCREVLEAELKD